MTQSCGRNRIGKLRHRPPGDRMTALATARRPTTSYALLLLMQLNVKRAGSVSGLFSFAQSKNPVFLAHINMD